MRILLGISILVLVAILWTGVSILRHIRLTQRRNRFLREQQGAEETQAAFSLPSSAVVAPLPARFAAPILERSSTTVSTDLNEKALPDVPASVNELRQLRVVTASSNITTSTVPLSMPTAAPAVAKTPEPAPLRIMEVVPDAANRDIFPSAPVFPSLAARSNPASTAPPPPPAAVPPPSSSQVRRPMRSVHQQMPGSRPAHRPDWIYFNKDMGDLSDPAPSRIRVRSR